VAVAINLTKKVDVDLLRQHQPSKSKRFIKSRKTKIGKSDDFSIFGEFVASKFIDLNSSRLQSIIQHKIHTMLLEAEMGLRNVPIHNEKTQLPVHFDSEPTTASYTVTSTPTLQTSSSSVSDYPIIATNPSSVNEISEFIAVK
jgi:hypothetical protein